MSIRSTVIAHEPMMPSSEKAPRPPLLVSVTCFIFLLLAALIFGVVTAASAQILPRLPELPQDYLPSNRMPQEVSCYQPSDGYLPRCSVEYEGSDVYFNFDADTYMTTQALIPARAYTIGQLVAVWGRPTGITRKETMVYLHWGARSALLYTRDFQPSDLVEFIQYDLEPLPASPWRGFGLFE